MTTIELSVDESMLAEVDQATRELEMTREDFLRTALERALQQQEIISLEQSHARGYSRQPQTTAEIGEWAAEQVWDEP